MASTRQLRSSKRRAQHPSSSVTTTIAPQSNNAQGLLSLADEIYLEILSHLPAFPIPNKHREIDNELYGHRRLALDALSQTCRTLRRVFLPYRWQRIEVYDRMDLGRGPLRSMGYKTSTRVTTASKDYAVELIRQLETVTVRNPSLAEFVTILDILVVDFSAKTVLPELARCIALLPNLHTVQIYFDVSQMYSTASRRTLIAETFASYTYPNIQTASVSLDGFSFLYSCPGLKVLIPRRMRNMFYNDLHKVVSQCPSIEILGPVLCSEPCRFFFGYIWQIARMKNLHDVSFKLSELPLDSDMKMLWKISNLKIIRFAVSPVFLVVSKIEEWKSRMEQILCKSGASTEGEHKRLIVTIIPV